MTQFDDLIIFYHLVTRGNVRSAADQLKQSEQELTEKLAAMERKASSQLLHRHLPTLTPTEAGNTLFEYAQQAQSLLTAANTALQSEPLSFSGTIKLAAPYVDGEIILPIALSRFSAKHPQVNLDLTLTHESLPLSDNLDLVLSTTSSVHPQMISEPIFAHRWVACASPSYLNTHGSPTHPADLYQHNCLGFKAQTEGAFEWQFTDGRHHYTRSLSGNFSVNSPQSLVQLCLAGQGILFVPYLLIASQLQSGQLHQVLPEHIHKETKIYATFPSLRFVPRKLRELSRFIQQAYNEHNHNNE
ncbi:LysR family transcriptional regulator [Thaumasiovibrio subtropicus]|uniref:LysR family transcriptional regulator n=1 Tax=Thaumasiovibrio subtropicus TaxID=1891207 RepID=UPI000B34B0AC|nr:LysR family transcriptional regulator [Thaumasiovibrio subtropicus]